MADRYWVSGSGNWSDTAHWSASSGGAGGASVPTSADNAIFDANSNTTAYTVTVDATANCLDLNFSAAPSVSGTITFAGSSDINIYGSLTMLSGMTRSFTGTWNFYATTTGKTITTNGVSFASWWNFDGAGGEWTLQDNVTWSAAMIYIRRGSLDTNGKTLTAPANAGINALGSGTSVLTFGASVISCAYLSIAASNVTVNAGTSSITCSMQGYPFAGGGQTFYDVSLTAQNAAESITGANTFHNLTITGGAAKTYALSLSANQTVTGTLAITGNSTTNRLLVQSNTLGTARTITAAAVSLSNADFMDITGAGAASPFTGTSLGDCLGNSGITFDAAATQYWYTTTTGSKTWSTAGNWFLGSGGTGGAGRVPLPQDTARFDASSIGAASTTISADMPRLAKNIDWTGVTNSPQWTFTTPGSLYGSLTLGALNGFNVANYGVSLMGRSSHTLSTNGITVVGHINHYAGTYTLGGALTQYPGYSWTTGTYALAPVIDTAGYAFTVGKLTGQGQSWTATLGASTVTLIDAGTVWSPSTFTLNAGTSTIKFTDATSSTKTFAGGGKTYNNIELAGAGTGEFQFTGSNTFNDFKISDAAKTIKFTAGTTTTVASFTGFDTYTATLNTVSGSGQATLAKSGGGTVIMQGASVTNMIGSPASTFYARAGTDGGNNTNWGFLRGDLHRILGEFRW